MQDALAQGLEPSAAVYAARDRLEAVDMSLDGAVAPRLDNGGAHSWLVLPEPCDEAAEIGRGCRFLPGL